MQPTTITKIVFAISLMVLVSCQKTPVKQEHVSTENRPPIMGWASWNNYHVNINEGIIKSQADAMVELGLDKYGYQYINIDDGFFGGRDEDGNIKAHPERFPSGMKDLATYIHAKCLKAGIYSDAGINTCASNYDKDTIGVGMGMFGHDTEDLALFLKEWKYDFIKIDWCGGKWLKLDEESRYSEIAKMARQINPDVVFNVCRWEFPGKWVTKLAHSWRIAGDLRANFNSILKTIDANANLWKYASYGHYNDMDMLQVGRGMSLEEDQAHFSMWCLMHSPLMLGNDLTQMNEQTLKIVTNQELIAINQAPFVYQARRIMSKGGVELWGRPLVSTMSGQVAVAILNRTKKTQSFSFNVNKVGIDAASGYSVKDLWTKGEITACSDTTLIREVAPHGVVVLNLKGNALPFNFYQFADGEK